MKFSFGRNWKSFSRFVTEKEIEQARADIESWLGSDGVAGKTVVDVGSGSGIHSLGFHRLGAASVLSLDVDPFSVACTRDFWEKSSHPANWRVDEVSILDTKAVSALGQFDIVYSWGVLHHTGDMWTAMKNAESLCKPHGCRLWVSLYAKGDYYPADLALKQRFNNANWFGKQAITWRYLARRWRNERRQGNKISDWFWHQRGMNAYHDTIDWVGGLPYEVASVEEVTEFLTTRGWTMERIEEAGEGSCSNYLFKR